MTSVALALLAAAVFAILALRSMLVSIGPGLVIATVVIVWLLSIVRAGWELLREIASGSYVEQRSK